MGHPHSGRAYISKVVDYTASNCLVARTTTHHAERYQNPNMLNDESSSAPHSPNEPRSPTLARLIGNNNNTIQIDAEGNQKPVLPAIHINIQLLRRRSLIGLYQDQLTKIMADCADTLLTMTRCREEDVGRTEASVLSQGRC
jgi:hypothetical protein